MNSFNKNLFAALSVAFVLNGPAASAQPAPETLDPAPHLKTAIKLTQIKKYNDAMTEVEKALELNPSYYEAMYQKALIHQLSGHPVEATKEYQDLLDLKPDNYMARINLGSLLRARLKF